MTFCIKVLKVFGYIWVTLAIILILVGIVGVWMKNDFSRVLELLSPFNVLNWIVMAIALAPGIAAIAWAEQLKERQQKFQ